MAAQKTPNSEKKGKNKLLLIILLLIILCVAAGGGYYYWQQQQGTQASQTMKQQPPPLPIFMPLDTFTVNLASHDQVLYIGITLRLPDDTTLRKLTDYLPEVRSRLLLLFSRQDADELATEEGKQKLISEIKKTLASPLVAGQPAQVITDVLYTTFILR